MTLFEYMRGNEIILNGLKYEFSNNILSFDEFQKKVRGGGVRLIVIVPLRYILYSVALGTTSLNLHKEIYK